MSDIIHLLPDSVANQIAAGEVIQRPASVIKELVENSVDAGATTIHVIVVDAGRTSIQVVDDGKGMSPTDARLSFERHATSKISQADDLFALRTMGFRGEALASIAAVAQVELQSRRQEDEVGTKLTIAGSRVTGQEPVSCPVGSNFKVDNLFFNVPARRKFLKTNATELNNILTAFERIVLVYPDIHFTLHHNGVEMLNLRAGSLRQRIADVFGKQYSQDLLPVEVHTAMCDVSGFVGKPEAARKKSGCDYFFVNGRFMRHAYFHKAVMKAYDRLVPEGMSIPYFLYIKVEPSEIDVNIHPTKTEIKFENEQAIWQILAAAVRDGIGKFCEVPSIDFDTQGQPDIPVFDNSNVHESYSSPRVNYNPEYNPFKQSSGGSRTVASQWETLYDGLEHGSFREEPAQQSLMFEDDNTVEPQSATEILSEKSPAHYQYKGKYLMTAVKSGLMIIDQHRASVRVLYDRYMSQFDSRVISTQKLLFPETIQFSPADAVTMQQLLPELSAIGFDLSDLGGNTYAVNGMPSGLEGLSPQSLLHEMVSGTNANESLSSIHSSLALRLAQSAAIPYGQILNNDEMEGMINDLFTCSNVNYTPDGKAILCILPQGDIEHLLG
ncbi:DNA mismatch repair endonuclease MutL [Prevotella sp. P6B1]|uniref:DNA mismatch repair endonuclease MutL n=1 Tax=Prevotella sp. P6B1 TaxID=1410613 RepID=UPI00051AC6AF|nr:DNA mismatch repair endonuclease MutL [Prevotella sp. P6B1]